MSLEQCNQKYSSMDFKLRSQLLDQISRYGADYRLDQCIFPSFVSQASFRTQYSASDVVYAVTGLLEATDLDGGDKPSSDSWKNNFYKALDALAMNKTALLKAGMDYCMKQHQAILRQVHLSICPFVHLSNLFQLSYLRSIGGSLQVGGRISSQSRRLQSP